MRLSLVCVLFDPAIPTSFFNFIQLFLHLFLFFFIALSVIYQWVIPYQFTEGSHMTRSDLDEIRFVGSPSGDM